MLPRLCLLVSCLVLIASCAVPPDSPRFEPSADLPPFDQDSFADYVRENRTWIAKHRAFISDDHDLEIDMNAPFEMRPETTPKRGILFVHGLGSSPWYFSDIATAMAKDGWLVRSILLPGHGTKSADLMLPNIDDWEKIISHQTTLLKNEVGEVWLGGFSTGGNLVTSYAAHDPDVNGLLLFSPGFYPSNGYLFLTPAISYLWDWVDIDTEDNIPNYQSLPSHGASLYYQTVSKVQDDLIRADFNRPVLITMSQHDSVLDPIATLDAFQSRFTNPRSRFVWYGETPPNLDDPRVTALSSNLLDDRISTFSHMNVLFTPENPYYGRRGSHIMFENGQEGIPVPEDSETLWFGAWGQITPGKYHARLTWNPYFNNLLADIRTVTGQP